MPININKADNDAFSYIPTPELVGQPALGRVASHRFPMPIDRSASDVRYTGDYSGEGKRIPLSWEGRNCLRRTATSRKRSANICGHAYISVCVSVCADLFVYLTDSRRAARRTRHGSSSTCWPERKTAAIAGIAGVRPRKTNGDKRVKFGPPEDSVARRTSRGSRINFPEQFAEGLRDHSQMTSDSKMRLRRALGSIWGTRGILVFNLI